MKKSPAFGRGFWLIGCSGGKASESAAAAARGIDDILKNLPGVKGIRRFAVM